MTEEDTRNLAFLKEMKEKMDSNDPLDREFVEEMIDDWIDELEGKP